MKLYRITVVLPPARTSEVREFETDTMRVDESGALHLIRDGQSVVVYANGVWRAMVDVGAMTMKAEKAQRENPGRVEAARQGSPA